MIGILKKSTKKFLYIAFAVASALIVFFGFNNPSGSLSDKKVANFFICEAVADDGGGGDGSGWGSWSEAPFSGGEGGGCP